MQLLLENLGHGFVVALSLQNLLFALLGALIGTAIGVLPGIGPVATISLLLPVTFGQPATTAIIMLAGIYYGAQYGGSTTAILLNLPGEVSSVVTTLEGYKMARNGRAGAALATAALGSFFAGTVATVLVAASGPLLTSVALSFGPADYFSLMLLGLIISAVLAQGSVLKSIAMVVLGVLLGLVGTDVQTGQQRFTFGIPELSDGIGFVPVAMGLFGIAEIVLNLERPEARSIMTVDLGNTAPTATALRGRMGGVGRVPGLGLVAGHVAAINLGFVYSMRAMLLTREELSRATPAVLRGTVVGSVLGILPGGGAALAAFASYMMERKMSRGRASFGNGAIEGVAGPEAANNAAAQTSFIPLLTLGIPANAVMALMVGALIIQGIQPGPRMVEAQPDLFWGLIASMWIGNLMLLVINLPLIGMWVKLLQVPYKFLYPSILVFCCIGVYSLNNNVFDVYLTVLFSMAGYLFSKLKMEPAPLLIGFVLGPMMEEHLRRAMLLSRGDVAVFVQRPISACMLAIGAIALIAMLAPNLRKKKEAAMAG